MVMILKIPNISANVIGAVRKELLLLFLTFLKIYCIIYIQNELSNRNNAGVILSSSIFLLQNSRKPTKSACGVGFARRSSRDKG